MDISLKRIIAYIIDIAIVTIVVTCISHIKFINPYLDTYNANYEEYTELVDSYNNGNLDKDEYTEKAIENNYNLSKSNTVNGIITIGGLVLYFGIVQMFLNGQTFGKRIMNIKLVSKDENKKLHVGNYLIRTIVLNNIIFRILIIVGVYFLNTKGFYNYSSVIGFMESIIESIIIIMIVLKRDNRGLHDIIAGTKVIDLKPLKEDIPVLEDKNNKTKTNKQTKKKSK